MNTHEADFQWKPDAVEVFSSRDSDADTDTDTLTDTDTGRFTDSDIEVEIGSHTWTSESESDDSTDKTQGTVAVPVPSPASQKFATASYDEELQTPAWILENSNVKFNRDALGVGFLPVLNIAQHSDLLKSTKDQLQVTILEPWPSVTFMDKLLFQIEGEKEKYEQLEMDMQLFYTSISNRAAFPHEKMKRGMHAVLFDKGVLDFAYKRVQIVGKVTVNKSKGHPNTHIVPVLPIDGGYELHVYAEELLFLYKQFACLPPRALNFKLDGMSYYERNASYRRASFMETGLWNGILDASLVAENSAEVVIHSGVANKLDFAYGVNELIIKRIAAELQEPRLPEVGQERSGAYVVHSSTNGEIFIQFETPFFKHHEAVMEVYRSTIPTKTGRIESPVTAGTILLAPHYCSDGSYYRAVCTEPSSDGTVLVKFIDFGDEEKIRLSDAVLATDIHKALEVIPPLAVSAFLDGVTNLDVNTFKRLVPPDQDISVKVTRRFLKRAEVELIHCSIKNGEPVRQNINALLLNKENTIVEDSITLPKFTSPFFVAHDIMSSDGQGSECIYYRKGKELVFQVVEIDDDGITSVFPDRISENLRKLELSLADAYWIRSKIIQKVYESPWKKYEYFMVQSDAFNRIVRATFVKTPVESEIGDYKADVFLIDYGIFEIVNLSSVYSIQEPHCRLPSYGVRATLLDEKGIVMDADTVKKRIRSNDKFLGKVVSAAKRNCVPEVVIQFTRKEERGNQTPLRVLSRDKSNTSELETAKCLPPPPPLSSESSSR